MWKIRIRVEIVQDSFVENYLTLKFEFEKHNIEEHKQEAAALQASVLVYYKGKMQAGLFVYNAKQVVQKGERIGALRRGTRERERGTRVCPQQAREKNIMQRIKWKRERDREARIYIVLQPSPFWCTCVGG